MKTKKIIQISFALVSMCIFTNHLMAQRKRPTLTVLNIDTKGVQLDAFQMGNIVRMEMEKLDTFDVSDRYEVISTVEKNNLNIANCYGKQCLVEVGKVLKSDYMFTGSAELYGQTIVVTFRLVNVATESVERTTVMEFLNLPLEIQSMASITIKKMFGRKVDQELLTRLTKKFDYESTINNPNKNRLNLQGPRFGYAVVFGQMAERLQDPKKEGGYDAFPAMFQFGYQFEKQYLNEGNFQALFEFIPMITGIEQEMFSPSITILNGFRNNKSGWEIAVGPSIGIGSYGERVKLNGRWYTKNEVETELNLTAAEKENLTYKEVMDSKGIGDFSAALVFAIGKSFKSGKMNIPINFWFTIPTDDGFRIGISAGYNTKQ
jgi:hypothetical protein